MNEHIIDCQAIFEFLIDYQERRLPLFERLRFKLHLLKCRNCADYMALYNQSSQVFRKALQEDPPPDALVDMTLEYLLKRPPRKGR